MNASSEPYVSIPNFNASSVTDRADSPAGLEGIRRVTAHWSDVQVTFNRVFELGQGEWLAVIAAVNDSGDTARLSLWCHAAGRPVLHWGLGVRSMDEWRRPPSMMQPVDSQPFDDRAVHSPFVNDESGSHLELELHPVDGRLPRAVNLVVYDAAGARWLKHGGRDIQVRLRQPRGEGGAGLEPIIEQIAEAESGDTSWTLMHRFNLCHDLLDEVEDDIDGMALLFAWLRYSAVRQLDWQRRYNTKPRELAHAQHRLTSRLALLFEPGATTRHEIGMWARLMLSTVGRGGEGQQVRDRILHIMHRHGIKERHGTWIEQWHQKLHNNTTPDDVIICAAYLAFLEADGDEAAYWRTLEQGGVRPERLTHFERPITLAPEHFPDKKDGLLHDFRDFLHLLKSVHAGTDLATSIDAAQCLLAPELTERLRQLLHRESGSIEALSDLVCELTAARILLHESIAKSHEGTTRRELLYVDLGLEMQLRTAVERVDLTSAPDALLASVVQEVLANLTLTEPSGEYDAVRRMWKPIHLASQNDRPTLLAALAAVERTSRAVRTQTDQMHHRLQPKAERFGQACHVEAWTIPIFSEEVVRGTLVFVLAKLVRHLEPRLKRRAGLGGWQIVAPGETVGRVQQVEVLREAQNRTFDEPTVLITNEIAGDEDIPANVRAVLTCQMPDLVSHVAVRARNEHVLLASCMDASAYAQLHNHHGHWMRVATTIDGDVQLAPADETTPRPTDTTPRPAVLLRRPRLSAEVVGPAQFNDTNVGGKARNLLALRDKLPESVVIPPSVALTFGAFEHLLDSDENPQAAARYRALLDRVDDDPQAILPELRTIITDIKWPQALRTRVAEVCQQEGFTLPEPADALWQAINQVWASKWNDRAYAARRRLNLAQEDVVMAVLLQPVIAADYAFVLHTTDPITDNGDTLYGELVVGLGETLVGNHPGTPLAFRANKRGLEIELHNLPSKSLALRGRGIIARSDSNAEDLPGYAGAGLHDSVMTEPAHLERLDYANEPIMWDEAFRHRLCRSLAELGVAIEQATGSAQDIEGVVRNDQLYALQTRPQVGLTL